jgi:hypothetical protein
MKYIRNPSPDGWELTQSEIPDELAALWISNGNTEIRDNPWPDLEMVQSYIVSSLPRQEVGK